MDNVVRELYYKMQIIFKAVTGRSGHAPWWEGKRGTVWARDAKNHGGSRWLAALESSLCYVMYGTLAYRSRHVVRN